MYNVLHCFRHVSPKKRTKGNGNRAADDRKDHERKRRRPSGQNAERDLDPKPYSKQAEQIVFAERKYLIND